MQFYTDETRQSDPHSLPDAEVFNVTSAEIQRDNWTDDDGTPYEPGFYWWVCSPGCLPDSEPFGPFDTESEAIEDARSHNQ